MTLLPYRQEAILMAATGVAADNIENNAIGLGQKRNPFPFDSPTMDKQNNCLIDEIAS
jgi:hypothetical protein